MIILEMALAKINIPLCQVSEYGDEGEEGPRNRRQALGGGGAIEVELKRLPDVLEQSVILQRVGRRVDLLKVDVKGP